MKKLIVYLVFVLLPLAAMSQMSDKVLWFNNSLGISMDYMCLHPNGNIIGGHNADVFEFSGADGSLIRKFKKFTGDDDISSFSISKDGNYITSSDIHTNITEYLTGKVIFGEEYLSSASVFFPDSKRVLIGGALDDSTQKVGERYRDSTVLMVYNLETFERKYLKSDVSYFRQLATSSDGKYFVTSGIYKHSWQDPYTQKDSRITLWDAVTLEPIKMLFEAQKVNYTFAEIKFSNDSKYLAVQDEIDGITVYNLSDYSVYKQYRANNKPPKGVYGFCFIGDSFMGLTGGAYDSTDFIEIINFKTDEVLYHTNEFGSYGSLIAYNPVYNSLIVTNTKYGHISLDMSKIVSVMPETHQATLNINYQDGMLFIDNVFLTAGSQTVNVFNVLGQVVKSSRIDQIQNTEKIQIPLEMSTGVYVVQIIDGAKEYSGKFIVE